VNVELRSKEVLVVGLGRSGRGAMHLCARLGANVTVTDQRDADDLGVAVQEARSLGVSLVLGEHRERDFLSSDLIVLSPGVPLDQPHIARALRAGIRVVGELELAASLLDCPAVAITGTNGKSTTTTFAGDLLAAAGWDAFVGGNLGNPLSDGVLDRRYDAAVLEVSSFQLETAPTFHPRVAAMLNCTEDHLDRYESFDDYRSAKERIFDNLGPQDVVVFNAGDPIVADMVRPLSTRTLAFSERDHGRNGAFVEGGAIHFRLGGGEQVLDLDGFVVPGMHNVENLMAAALCVLALGARFDALAEALPRLRGLPHRMEWVRALDEVDWYNDSKATNVASAAKTLGGQSRAAVILLGGKDKGGDYAPLVRTIRDHARAVVVYGQAAGIIAEALREGGQDHVRVETLDEAVAAARERARPGDMVLLSPACSSFDQFQDYEQRGETFRQLVEALR